MVKLCVQKLHIFDCSLDKSVPPTAIVWECDTVVCVQDAAGTLRGHRDGLVVEDRLRVRYELVDFPGANRRAVWKHAQVCKGGQHQVRIGAAEALCHALTQLVNRVSPATLAFQRATRLHLATC